MTLEYVLTFGIFSGLAGSFGMLIKQQYGTDMIKWVFLGAFVGSLARICWGPLCDRFGGGPWTVVSGLGIAASAAVVLYSYLFPTGIGHDGVTEVPGRGIFMLGMVSIFFFSGIGNAATFKQMPTIFEPRQAGGVIGWTAAIAAFGPFIFGVLFAQFAKTAVFGGVIVYALICAVVAWWYYARSGAEARS